MTKAKNEGPRVVVFKDGDMYVAQCLEDDICAQAVDLNTLRCRMDAAIDAERDYSRSAGRTLEDIGQAPKHFFDQVGQGMGLRTKFG